MNKRILIFCLISGFRFTASAQSQEVQQLLLNAEKLTQFKNILTDMKNGYQILSKGYNAVKDISQGNFSLHSAFIDALMQVSPEVRKYHKIAEIISNQQKLVKEYKAAYQRAGNANLFSSSELSYLSKVYTKLNKAALENLDQLLMVITSGQLSMNDQERLAAIDRLHDDTHDKLQFLRSFNRNTALMLVQRQQSQTENQHLKEIYP